MMIAKSKIPWYSKVSSEFMLNAAAKANAAIVLLGLSPEIVHIKDLVKRGGYQEAGSSCAMHASDVQVSPPAQVFARLFSRN